MDTVLGIDEVSTGLLGTFLCGVDSGTCPVCHPSCASACDPGPSYGCNCAGTQTQSSTSDYCICSDASKIGRFGGCINPCHASCDTCSGPGAGECLTCKAPGATLSGNTCVCGSGYAYAISPSSCTGCPSSHSYCLSGTDTYVWPSQDIVIFALTASSLDSLPYQSQTHNLLCYREDIVNVNDCTITAITNEIGSIGTAGSYAATLTQCYNLLSMEWGFVTSWFTTMFPNFTPPVTAALGNVNKVKTILQLWILQFGPSDMKEDTDWQALVSVFNSATTPWTTMMAWTSPSPQYTTDGTTVVNFPADLTTWLGLVSVDVAAFNTFNTVCGTANCGNSNCAKALPSSPCGTTP